MLVLVLLAIVWVAALTPMVLRKLREREVVTSVTSFNRHLLRLSGHQSREEREGSVPGAAIGFSAAAKRLADQRFGQGAVTASDAGSIGFAPRFSTPTSQGVAGTAEIGPIVSHATTIRRRRVVVCLALGTLVSFALGFGLSAFFYLAVACLVATAAYLGLLAYFHQLAVEQVQKVVALETRREMANALNQARTHCGSLPAGAARPRVGGSGWSVPEEELEGYEGRQLVSVAGR